MRLEEYTMGGMDENVARTRSYYDSSDADMFYRSAWGEEHIHQGIFQYYDEPMQKACQRTVKKMTEEVGSIGRSTRVLDVGSGYGGTARYLAQRYGCHLTTLNLSKLQNARSEKMNRRRNLSDLIEVVEGSFEEMPFSDGSMDVCWSIDAMLHSGDRDQVISEMSRVLKSGGDLVFTDPMRTEKCPKEVLNPILERISLSDMGSQEFYRESANKHGLEEVSFRDYTEHLVTTYARVLRYTEENESVLAKRISMGFIKHMEEGLRHWVSGGTKGHLVWGIFHFRKK